MPQEIGEDTEINILIRFHRKVGYVGFDICWHGLINWVMMNMIMMMMEITSMRMTMISLSLKTLPYCQGMHLV